MMPESFVMKIRQTSYICFFFPLCKTLLENCSPSIITWYPSWFMLWIIFIESRCIASKESVSDCIADNYGSQDALGKSTPRISCLGKRNPEQQHFTVILNSGNWQRMSQVKRNIRRYKGQVKIVIKLRIPTAACHKACWVTLAYPILKGCWEDKPESAGSSMPPSAIRRKGGIKKCTWWIALGHSKPGILAQRLVKLHWIAAQS